MYNEKFFILLTFSLEENFILKNPNDWVWCLWIFSLYLFLFLVIPYIFIYIYLKFKSSFFKEEDIIFNLVLFLSAYNFFFTLFLLFQDFIFSGIISLYENKKFYFEFQPEIENFIFYFLGIFWDFLFSVVLYNIIYFYFFIVLKKQIKFLIQCSILVLIYYWFGGENKMQDLIFIFIIYMLLELIYIFNLILVHLRKISI